MCWLLLFFAVCLLLKGTLPESHGAELVTYAQMQVYFLDIHVICSSSVHSCLRMCVSEAAGQRGS